MKTKENLNLWAILIEFLTYAISIVRWAGVIVPCVHICWHHRKQGDGMTVGLSYYRESDYRDTTRLQSESCARFDKVRFPQMICARSQRPANHSYVGSISISTVRWYATSAHNLMASKHAKLLSTVRFSSHLTPSWSHNPGPLAFDIGGVGVVARRAIWWRPMARAMDLNQKRRICFRLLVVLDQFAAPEGPSRISSCTRTGSILLCGVAGSVRCCNRPRAIGGGADGASVQEHPSRRRGLLQEHPFMEHHKKNKRETIEMWSTWTI